MYPPSIRPPIQLPLPAAVCDGGLHHFELRLKDAAIDQSFDLVPAQLTPWGALQLHSRPPFPGHLSPLASEHYRSLSTWLHWADLGQSQLPADLPLLQRLLSQPVRLDQASSDQALPEGLEPGALGEARTRIPLHLPISAAPQVSVVVPVHNQYAVTRRCLAALAYAPTQVPFEVLVAIDSTKATSSAAPEAKPKICRLPPMKRVMPTTIPV